MPPPPTSSGRRKPLALRTFTIPTSATTTATISITEPALVADQLPLETWASSSVLASQLHRLPLSFPPAPSPLHLPLVELGAGTGLVGIAAALIYATDVVLTDLPPILPSLRANAALNAQILQGRGAVRAGVLDWTAPGTLRVDGRDGGEGGEVLSAGEGAGKAHVMLAADTLYSPDHPVLLARTVDAWLSRERGARFVLATALRVAYLEEITELWERLGALGLEVESEGQERAAEEDFDDERLVEWSVWRWKTESG